MRLVKEPSAVRGLAEPGFRQGPVRAQRACIVLDNLITYRLKYNLVKGPIAQLEEPPAHNR